MFRTPNADGMKIKFYLDKPNDNKETAIYMFLRFKKNTLKFNTRKRIHPKYWNPNTPESHFRKFTGSPELNHWLSGLRTTVERKYLSQNEWLLDDLKAEVDVILDQGEPKDTRATFEIALLKFIESRIDSRELANSTIKKYKTLESHLKSFSTISNAPLRFEKVNKQFYERFSAYLRNDLHHTTNTVNKYLKTFKTFINWSIDHDYTTSEKASTKFKITDSATEVIYLNKEELKKLVHLDLPFGSTLAKVRDVFCFGCFTGQRFSDIANLKHTDISGTSWILHQIKVKDTIQIEVPLNELAMMILGRYKDEDRPLPVISNQKTNQYLKLLCERAGINEWVKVVRYRGNQRIELREPKYKFIGTHTARRTFITLSLEDKMRPETVMAITGHNDFKTMKRYIAVTNKIKEHEMKAVWNYDMINEMKESSAKIS